MKPKSRLIMVAISVLAFSLMFYIPAFAGSKVTLQGKLIDGGKRIVGDDGQRYTIIPDESIAKELSDLDGKRVELEGVAYESHGRHMITAFGFKALE